MTAPSTARELPRVHQQTPSGWSRMARHTEKERWRRPLEAWSGSLLANESYANGRTPLITHRVGYLENEPTTKMERNKKRGNPFLVSPSFHSKRHRESPRYSKCGTFFAPRPRFAPWAPLLFPGRQTGRQGRAGLGRPAAVPRWGANVCGARDPDPFRGCIRAFRNHLRRRWAVDSTNVTHTGTGHCFLYGCLYATDTP